MSALSEHLRFLGRAMLSPSHVGSIAPSGSALAAAMAAQTDPAREGRLLELGPGTGSITAALIARGYTPDRITAVERDEQFAAMMEKRWPLLRVVRGNALALGDLVDTERFAYVVSGLPLLNLPDWQRERLIMEALAHLTPGGALIQYSYGFMPPAEPPEMTVTKAATVWRNLPPARVWVYRSA
jgi:phosphatidylethanolamine/phosphatidyl-N-methylethanolamine N-methyltransferase